MDNLQHRVYLTELREALNRHDPIQLIDKGAPEHEYDSERSVLAARLLHSHTAEEALAVVHDVFCEWFDPQIAGPRETYRDLADELFTIAQRWKALPS